MLRWIERSAGFGKPETFNFLGFTFICGRSRRGSFLLKRKSRRDRVRTKLKEIKVELRQRMHWPIPEQGSWLAQVIRGFFAYHAVPSNIAALGKFRHQVIRHWLRTLRRPKILHPWPAVRFAATHPSMLGRYARFAHRQRTPIAAWFLAMKRRSTWSIPSVTARPVAGSRCIR